MIVDKIMQKNPLSVSPDQTVDTVFHLMRQEGLHCLPVVGSDGSALGVLSDHTLLSHVVPGYILSGDLTDVAFAPDLGVCKQHYEDNKTKHVSDVMDVEFVKVKTGQSLISVGAALLKHEGDYAVVVDGQGILLGTVSAGDILDFFQSSL